MSVPTFVQLCSEWDIFHDTIAFCADKQRKWLPHKHKLLRELQAISSKRVYRAVQHLNAYQIAYGLSFVCHQFITTIAEFRFLSHIPAYICRLTNDFLIHLLDYSQFVMMWDSLSLPPARLEQLLEESILDINALDDQCLTLLNHAVLQECPHIMKWLLENGAKVHVPGSKYNNKLGCIMKFAAKRTRHTQQMIDMVHEDQDDVKQSFNVYELEQSLLFNNAAAFLFGYTAESQRQMVNSLTYTNQSFLSCVQTPTMLRLLQSVGLEYTEEDVKLCAPKMNMEVALCMIEQGCNWKWWWYSLDLSHHRDIYAARQTFERKHQASLEQHVGLCRDILRQFVTFL